MPKYWALGAVLAVSIGWPLAATADVTIPDEYAKMIQQRSRIGTLDGGFFGDHVSLATGSLEIVQTDVDLPGNNALPVRVGRRFRPGNYPAAGNFGDWDLDIPHLHGVFADVPYQGGWTVKLDSGAPSDQRCSQFDLPPEVSPPQNGTWGPEEYWHGTFLYLPGSGDQEFLRGGDKPASGGPYPTGTKEGAVARCLSTLASTSEADSTGEGFEVVTPDGTTYRFDQMVSRYAEGLKKAEDAPPMLRNGRGSRVVQGVDTGTDAIGTCCSLRRVEIFLYPTEVTDRFGNTVTYTWSATNPGRLEEISSSDGRHLYLMYSSSDPDSILVQSVSDGVHQWAYGYTGSVQVDLATVTQPDSASWQFDLAQFYINAKPHPLGIACDSISNPGSGTWIGTITAPSGAQATYTLAPKVFGRSWIYWDCKVDSNGVETPTEPNLFVSVAITDKTIKGPGLPSLGLTWHYDYGVPNNCWNPAGVPSDDPDAVRCTASSPTTRTVTVTDPDQSKSHYSFGNRRADLYGLLGNEGLLKSQDRTTSTGTVLSSTTFEYGDGDAAPYGSHQGLSLRIRGDGAITGQRRPQRSTVTSQQGTTFSWSVPNTCGGNYCFDTWARPTTVVRSGPNGTGTTSRTETTAYDDDTTHWVLGQVASRTIAGVVASSTTFDASHRPWKVYAFGKLQNTFTYNGDGTLATVADGNGNATAYSDWRRGIPKSVAFADGSSRSAVVDDRGWITSVTDENGFETTYEYDAMGRIKTVIYPASDSQTWEPTTSTFAPVMSAENGLAAGHWRETVSTGTGNTRKVTLFDALWRPVLVREYDNANPTATDRYVATAYDNAGRVSDASYPLDSTGSALTLTSAATWQFGAGRPKGVRTSYDALGRPTLVRQDSELGVISTSTAYLTNFQRQVTDARNNVTTEQFMAWDSPTFDLPVQIDAPEGQRTTIVRDTFGKPISITRGATP